VSDPGLNIEAEEPYNSMVRQYFVSPIHAGDLQLPYSLTASVTIGDGYGNRLQLSAGVSGDTLDELRFRALGCPHLIAAAEHFCRHNCGQAVETLQDFDTGRMTADLAVPVRKSGRILLLEDAVGNLWRQIIETRNE
jgi:NifU-like protein involved in Fe-S cluster formation